MQPKIIFLGTGGDDIVVGKQLRSAGGIIIQVMENQIHIDPGPGAVARAADYNVNLRNNIAVIATNNYMNHAASINSVISGMTLGGLDRKGVLICAKSTYEGYMDMDPMINRYFKNFLEKDIILKAGNRVGINEIEVYATHTENPDEDAIGLRIVTPKFSLGYTSATSYHKKMAEDYKHVDIMIFHCPGVKEQEIEGTLNINDIMKLMPEIEPRLAILTGFGIKMHEGDVLAQARAIQKETKIQTIAAKDGMVLNPVSYSVNLRQRTLKLF